MTDGIVLPDELPPSKKPSALVDAVDAILRSKWKDSELRKYLESIENDKSVTGSVEIDRAFAAKLVIEAGIETGLAEMFDGKSVTRVRSAINAALKRHDYGTQQRLERLKLLEGQVVPEELKKDVA
jgi:hypothetical protein